MYFLKKMPNAISSRWGRVLFLLGLCFIISIIAFVRTLAVSPPLAVSTLYSANHKELTIPVRSNLKDVCPADCVAKSHPESEGSPVLHHRAAIVGLVRGYKKFKDYAGLEQRNHAIATHVTKYHPHVDVILFHEGDMAEEHSSRLKKAIPTMQVRSIATLWKQGQERHRSICGKERSDKNVQCLTRHEVGFILMCRFYSYQMFPMLAAEGYRFVWRLDDDGVIGSPVAVDVFGLMANFGYVYGFKKLHSGQHEDVLESLSVFAMDYVVDHRVPVQCDIADLTRTVHFANNIFLTDTAFWVRSDVSAFLKAVDDSNGFFVHGWGDSLIMALALKIFAPPEKIAQLLSLDYNHGSHSQVLPKGAGDWTLRFYGDMEDWKSRQLSRIASSARSIFSLGNGVTLDETRLLSPYFCNLHIVTLDLASQRLNASSNNTPSCTSNIPTATMPGWVCDPSSTPAVAGPPPLLRSPSERFIDLHTTCTPPLSAADDTATTAAPPVAAKEKHRSPHEKKLGSIKRCKAEASGVAAAWMSCVRRATGNSK